MERYERTNGALPRIGWPPREALAREFGHRCPACGQHMEATADNAFRHRESRAHVVPTKHPLRVKNHWFIMCFQCNQDQGNRHIIAWLHILQAGRDPRAPNVQHIVDVLSRYDRAITPALKRKRRKKMKVELVDYTGIGYDPEHAVNILLFTKNTRLQMSPGGLAAIRLMPMEDKLKELEVMARTIPSSWEFVNYTFLVTNVTRAYTHQQVRTREGSYAQQTMRVLDVSRGNGWTYGTGPSIANDGGLERIYAAGMGDIAATYRALIAAGAEVEDARGILPTNIHTNIVCKFNMRTLVQMSRKRAGPRTQGEYREVLEAMRAAAIAVHPWLTVFMDRTVDRVFTELDECIAKLSQSILDRPAVDATRTRALKLIDELRAEID